MLLTISGEKSSAPQGSVTAFYRTLNACSVSLTDTCWTRNFFIAFSSRFNTKYLNTKLIEGMGNEIARK